MLITVLALLSLITLTWCQLTPSTPDSTTQTGSDTTTGSVDTNTGDINQEPSNTGDNSTGFTTTTVGELAESVTVTTLLENSIIASPLTIEGTAPGNWFFEASAPVTVVNRDGLIIWEWYITASGDWMTTNLVPFYGTISYNFDPATPYNYGRLILKRNNASDDPLLDSSLEIPVLFN